MLEHVAHDGIKLTLVRCVNCGHRTDCTIEANRALTTVPRVARSPYRVNACLIAQR